MRVLAVASSYPRRPDDFAGHFVRTGLLALRDRGHDVTIVHPHPGGETQFVDDPGLRRCAVRTGKGRSRLAYRGGMLERMGGDPRALLQAPLLARALRRAVRERAADHDVVLSHWLIPGGWAAAASALPHVCVLHSGGVHLLRALPFGGRLAAQIASRTDHFVAVSRQLRESFLAALPRDARRALTHRVEVRPNPLPSQAFDATRTATKRPLVLFLGRLERVKGVDVLLDALRPQDPFDVVVAGTGAQRESLQTQARRRGLRPTFVGHVEGDAKRNLLARADVLVVPSRVLPRGRTEGAPTVVAEAHAAGLPVLASSVGGLSEMIRQGETGWLVPPEEPAALRAQLLSSIGMRATVGPACRVAAEAYRPAAFGTYLQTLLTSLVGVPA